MRCECPVLLAFAAKATQVHQISWCHLSVCGFFRCGFFWGGRNDQRAAVAIGVCTAAKNIIQHARKIVVSFVSMWGLGSVRLRRTSFNMRGLWVWGVNWGGGSLTKELRLRWESLRLRRTSVNMHNMSWFHLSECEYFREFRQGHARILVHADQQCV